MASHACRVGQGGEGPRVTFGGLAVPDHEGAQHVAWGQELTLCILPADALEEPPGGKGREWCVNSGEGVLSRHQETKAWLPAASTFAQDSFGKKNHSFDIKTDICQE